MNEIPLHPALVHLPLGLAIFMPAIFIGLFLFIKREKLSSASFLLAVLLQAVLALSAVAAIRTGEAEEDRLEEVGISVPHEAIEEHEEMAKIMTGVAFAVLLLSAASLKKSSFSSGLQIGSIVLSLVVTGLAMSTGHRGGELVYVHGAAGQGPVAEQPATGADANGEHQHDDDHGGESDH